MSGRPCRQFNAVPFKGTVFFYTPGIRLVGAVFGKGKRSERNLSHIKILGRYLLSLIDGMQCSHKPHDFLHILRGKIRIFAIVRKEVHIVGQGRLAPIVIVNAKLVQPAITIRITGHGLANA